MAFEAWYRMEFSGEMPVLPAPVLGELSILTWIIPDELFCVIRAYIIY